MLAGGLINGKIYLSGGNGAPGYEDFGLTEEYTPPKTVHLIEKKRSPGPARRRRRAGISHPYLAAPLLQDEELQVPPFRKGEVVRMIERLLPAFQDLQGAARVHA